MDRVNRSFFIVAMMIAIPVALGMTSLSTGDTPQVDQAIALDTQDSGAIQQVAGKEVSTRKTRPGLLQVLAGSREEGDRDHRHENMTQKPSRGLLNAVLNGNRNSGNRSQASNRSQSNNRSNTSRSSSNRPSSNGPPANQSSSGRGVWDGVPYHQVNSSRPQTGDQPLTDSGSRVSSGQVSTGSVSSGPVSSGPTRVIRGGSARSIPATPASSRRPGNGPTLAPTPAPPLAVPTPPADLEPLPTPAPSLSRQSSSRRSNRRELQPLDPSEIAAASKITPKSESSDNGLIPRVPRKQVAPSTQPETSVAQNTGNPGAGNPSAANPGASSRRTASNTPAPAATPPQGQIAATSPTRATSPTPAAGPTPAPSMTVPTRAADVQPRVASSQPAITTSQPVAPLQPSAAPSQPSTALTTIAPPPATELTEPNRSSGTIPTLPAGRPNTSPVPTPASQPATIIAGVPTQPYASSTPSLSVPSISASHRSGPPSEAFQPTEPQFQPTATPVGSGVVQKGDVASFRSQPTMPTNQPSVESYTVPQGANANEAQGRMTTFGQPVANAESPRINSSTPSNTTPALPMPAGQPNAGDNFTRSEYDGRNQMRDSRGTDNVSAATTSELPGIRVLTYGPGTMMLRQTSQYEIRVENRGSIDATGVMVRATVPKWAELRSRNATRGGIENDKEGSTEHLVWRIDHLPAGASEQMFVRLTASKSGTFNLDVDWTLIPQKSITQVQVHEPKLDLTIEGPDEVVFGKSQTYKVRVLNPGDGTAPNVVFTLSPNSATPQTQRIGDIPPGKEAQFDVELTAQDLGDLQIHGLASGDLDLRTESVKTIKVAAAELEAILSGPELKYQNTDAMYSLQLQNTGAAASEKIIASLRLPNGVKYLGGMDEATLQGGVLKWEVTSLPPGATREYQFRCMMTSTGEHLFAFDCSGTAAGAANVALSTRVESIADLVLTVSDPPAPAPIGSDVTYEIVIRNRGSKEATDVKTIAQFSHGIEPQRIEGQRGEVVTGQVLFDTIPKIGAGQEIRMRVIAKAESGGHHRFRTEVRAGDTVLVAEEATHYMSPRSDRVSRRSSDGSNE